MVQMTVDTLLTLLIGLPKETEVRIVTGDDLNNDWPVGRVGIMRSDDKDPGTAIITTKEG